MTEANACGCAFEAQKLSDDFQFVADLYCVHPFLVEAVQMAIDAYFSVAFQERTQLARSALCFFSTISPSTIKYLPPYFILVASWSVAYSLARSGGEITSAGLGPASMTAQSTR
jgi:hypothetical protein